MESFFITVLLCMGWNVIFYAMCADGGPRRRKTRMSFLDTFNKQSLDMINQEDVNELVSCISYPH